MTHERPNSRVLTAVAKLWAFMLLCLLPSCLMALPGLPAEALHPGGIAVIPVSHHPTPPEVYYRGHRALVFRMGDEWRALVGIPLDAKPVEHVHLRSFGRQSEIAFRVAPKAYPTQHLHFKRYKKGVPTPKAVIERLEKEKLVMHATFKQYRMHLPKTLTFIEPVRGRHSSPFGARRVINGEPKQPHSGLDIAAPTGTPVRSVLAGVVTLVANHMLTGKTVVIDHGAGLHTVYCHLHNYHVKANQTVNRGQKIGTVGKTGRATGPHLHFGVNLNGVRVDPTLFRWQST